MLSRALGWGGTPPPPSGSGSGGATSDDAGLKDSRHDRGCDAAAFEGDNDSAATFGSCRSIEGDDEERGRGYWFSREDEGRTGAGDAIQMPPPSGNRDATASADHIINGKGRPEGRKKCLVSWAIRRDSHEDQSSATTTKPPHSSKTSNPNNRSSRRGAKTTAPFASSTSPTANGYGAEFWDSCHSLVAAHNAKGEKSADSNGNESEFWDSIQDLLASDDEEAEGPPAKIREDPSGPGPYRRVLKETLSSAGQWAFGVSAIEVWVLNEKGPEGPVLERADGGWWLDPIFQSTGDLDRLVNEEREDALPAVPVVPGHGLPGIIYSEESTHSDGGSSSWRDLRSLADDPDRFHCPRLALCAEVFGLAAGMMFHCRSTGLRGMCIFYARRAVDISKLSSDTNRLYLRSSANLLGGVVAWDEPRRRAVEDRRRNLDAALRRVKWKMIALQRIGALNPLFRREHAKAVIEKTFSEGLKGRKGKEKRPPQLRRSSTTVSIRDELRRRGGDTIRFANHKVVTTARKIRKGGGQLPPPPLSWDQCLFALFGCSLSLLTLSGVNEVIKKSTGGQQSIMLGPLGALVTMHYGLTSAPASQPRNSIFGLLVAGVIAKCISYIPTIYLPVWIRIAVGPAIAIVASLALGIPHPPGGAVAVIFSDRGGMPWSSLGLLLFGYCEAVMFASIFINMNENRTFPMYWGLPNAQDIRRGWEELRKDPLRPIRAARGVLVTEWRYRTTDIRRLGFKRWLCGLRCGGRGEDAKSGMSDGREGQTGNDRGDTTNPDDESVATNERDCEEGPKCTRDRTLDLMPTTSTRSMFSSEGVGEG